MPDNERRLSAQLQDQLWKMIRRVLHNRPSRVGTPRHRNQSSNLIRHELIPHLRSTPSDNIHNSLWKAGLFHQPHHLDRTERGVARRLRHNRIPGNQRRSKFPSDCGRWKVPRSNRGNHTDWKSENHDSLAGVVTGQNITLDPTGKLSIILEIRRCTVNLAASLEQRLSLLQSQESGQPLLVPSNQLSRLEKKIRPLKRRKIFPLRLSLIRRFKRSLRLLATRFWNGSNHSLSGRIDHLNRLLSLRINPFTINQHPIVLRESLDRPCIRHVTQSPPFNSPASLRKPATLFRSSSVRR